MIQFAVSVPASPDAWASSGAKRNDQSGVSPVTKELYNFATQGHSILFAGSRHLNLQEHICYNLLSVFSSLGAHFLTGCARGIDACFRQAFIDLGYQNTSFVGCAFNRSAAKCDVPAKKVVPNGLKPAVALAKRTVWLVNEADLLILFPSNPIGKGSALAFKTAVKKNKPVFIVQEHSPAPSDDYEVYQSSLFGLIHGFWVLPHVYQSYDERYLVM